MDSLCYQTQTQARRKQLQIGGAHIIFWGGTHKFFFLIFFLEGGGIFVQIIGGGGGTAPRAPPIPTALKHIIEQKSYVM